MRELSVHDDFIDIDGLHYTSSTQFVMAEQARLFGDEQRRQELLAAHHEAAPHKAFDHKAPKTGVRRVKNFDPAVWERYRERLMWRGTYEKFAQNPALKRQMFQVGDDRRFVEATEDPVWGIGITLDHPDARAPRKWRGPNLMGEMLTDVREVLRMEGDTPVQCSAERVAYVLERSRSFLQHDDLLDKMIAFGDRVLYQTGDPDAFPVPGWPGSSLMEQVYNFYLEKLEMHPSNEEVVQELVSGLKMAGDGVLKKEERGSVAWNRACLYLLEGAFHLRRF